MGGSDNQPHPHERVEFTKSCASRVSEPQLIRTQSPIQSLCDHKNECASIHVQKYKSCHKINGTTKADNSSQIFYEEALSSSMV